jgi:hypothetical protein
MSDLTLEQIKDMVRVPMEKAILGFLSDKITTTGMAGHRFTVFQAGKLFTELRDHCLKDEYTLKRFNSVVRELKSAGMINVCRGNYIVLNPAGLHYFRELEGR